MTRVAEGLDLNATEADSFKVTEGFDLDVTKTDVFVWQRVWTSTRQRLMP